MSEWRTKKVFGRPWQDLLFAVGDIVFLTALVPLLWSGHVPAFTGLSTAGMLYCFAVAQASYRNWITMSLGTLTATIWLFLGLGVRL